TPYFEAYAEDLGVPLRDFSACLARDAMAPLIISDVRAGNEAGITGTPSFVFNKLDEFNGDETFYGTQPMDTFLVTIERVRNRQP
ncbi:MAG: DsbA family protein, partial [Planctomycetota bacterium]